MRYGIAAALAAALPLIALAARAQPVAQPPFSHADLQAFSGNARSLIHAIHRIERMTHGRVAEIRFTDWGGVPGYHAVVMRGGRVEFMRLDERSGKLEPFLHKTEPVWMLHWRGQIDAHLVEHAKVPLARAVAVAERADGNQPAVAAGIARSASNPDSHVHAYNVLIDRDGAAQRVAVDDSSGQVIADAQAMSG